MTVRRRSVRRGTSRRRVVRRSGRGLKQSTATTIPRPHPRHSKINDLIAQQNAGVRMLNNKKRRRSGTDTVESKRNQGNQYYQHERRYIKQGRRLSALGMCKAVTRMGNNSVLDLGHRDYTNFSSATANSLGLNRYSGAGSTYYPIYCYDLTNANHNATRTNIVPAAVRLYNDGSYWLWQALSSIQQDGTKTLGITANIPNGLKVADHNVNWDQSLLLWIQMQFNITGPKTRPCKVSFELCKIREQYVDPFQPPQGGSTPEFDKHQKYWGRQAAELVENPIHKLADWQRISPFKVICRRVLDFQPTSTTESDSRGHIQTLKWFRRVNRICNYKATDMQTITGAQAQSAFEPAPLAANIANNVNMVPRMRDRFMMVVRSTCWELDVSPLPGNDTTNARIEWNITARHRVPEQINVVLPDP